MEKVAKQDKSLKPNSADKFPLIVLALQIMAFWNVWRWLFVRYSTSTEEIWGIVALFAAILCCFLFQNKTTENNVDTKTLVLAGLSIFLYIACFAIALPLIISILAMLSLTFTLSRWRFGKTFHLGFFSLLVLGLPLISSLNFYIGFPLRVIVGEAVEFILQLQGLNVIREGVCLHFGEKMIWIDAPCSGVKMLWFGMFLTALLTFVFKMNSLRSTFSFIAGFVLIISGNIFRAAALFYSEAELVKVPVWMHEAVGVFAFALTSIGIVFIVKKIAEAKWQKLRLS